MCAAPLVVSSSWIGTIYFSSFALQDRLMQEATFPSGNLSSNQISMSMEFRDGIGVALIVGIKY